MCIKRFVSQTCIPSPLQDYSGALGLRVSAVVYGSYNSTADISPSNELSKERKKEGSGGGSVGGGMGVYSGASDA